MGRANVHAVDRGGTGVETVWGSVVDCSWVQCLASWIHMQDSGIVVLGCSVPSFPALHSRAQLLFMLLLV